METPVFSEDEQIAQVTFPVRRVVLALCVLAAALSWAAEASATGSPQPQHQVRGVPDPPWRAVRVGPHVFYGTIAAVRGPQLVVRLRSGRLQAVNAAAAIAHGDCSLPLFVGKIVSVDGVVTGSTFYAAHVFRMTNLAQLGADR